MLAAMDTAIATDHPCSDDVGCDIEVARSNGFTVAAAILLRGATETPALNAMLANYDLTLPSIHGKAFGRWCAWHREHGHQCEACEAFMYADLPVRCTDCHHLITEANEVKEDS